MTRQASNPRLRQIDRPQDGSGMSTSASEGDYAAMAQLDDLMLKMDHLQATVSNVAIDIVKLNEYQSSLKENNQKFWAQDWPVIIKGQQSLQDKCNAIEREVSELKPLLKQIVDHEQRLRDVERSVTKMGVIASVLGAVFGVVVSAILKFIKVGS